MHRLVKNVLAHRIPPGSAQRGGPLLRTITLKTREPLHPPCHEGDFPRGKKRFVKRNAARRTTQNGSHHRPSKPKNARRPAAVAVLSLMLPPPLAASSRSPSPPVSACSNVPGGVGAFPRMEFKFPYLWYHSRFAWPSAISEETLQSLRTTIAPSAVDVLVPGRDGTVMDERTDGLPLQLAPRAQADFYFRQLLEAHAALMLQALARGWRVRHHPRM